MIDAVVTWVDGNDPAHRAKRAEVASQHRSQLAQSHRHSVHPTRFASSEEARFCLNSIRRNAPWIRHIFLVTDTQIPAWLDSSEQRRLNVQIVDHRDIFSGYEQFLPTFNSMSIEMMLHRIPDLSELFLYLNDDVFLINPTQETDYFHEGKPIFRGTWRWNSKLLNELLKPFKLADRKKTGIVGRKNEARYFPMKLRGFGLAHAPHPVSRTIMEQITSRQGFPEQQLQYRFRHKRQFWSLSLQANYAFYRDRALAGPDDWSYANAAKQSVDAVQLEVINAYLRGCRSLCLQSLDSLEPRAARTVNQRLSELTLFNDDGDIPVE